MKKLFLALVLFSCTTTKEPAKPLVTKIDFGIYGQSTVTNEYEDSTTIVNLTPEGELISDTTIKK